MSGDARAFIAILPPPEVCDTLAALPPDVRPGVRWTRRDQWHVTLSFLGTVPLAEAASALARLDAAPTEVTVGPVVEVLGRSVVVAPVAGVDDLAEAVHAVTGGIGEPPDPRGFRGHITLARTRGDARALPVVGERVAGSFTAREVQLMRSDPGAEGPVYSVVETVALH